MKQVLLSASKEDSTCSVTALRMLFQIFSLLRPPWPRCSKEIQETEAEFNSLDTDNTWIAKLQRIRELKSVVSRDKSEKMLRHPFMPRWKAYEDSSVITLYISGKREKKYPIIVCMIFLLHFILFGLDFLAQHWIILSFGHKLSGIIWRWWRLQDSDKCLCTAFVYRQDGKQKEAKGCFTDVLASNLWWVLYKQDTKWNAITIYYYFYMISWTTFSLYFNIITFLGGFLFFFFFLISLDQPVVLHL